MFFHPLERLDKSAQPKEPVAFNKMTLGLHIDEVLVDSFQAVLRCRLPLAIPVPVEVTHRYDA